MSKGSGNTRITYPQQAKVRVVEDRASEFERTYVSPSGGYVDTSLQRILDGHKNKNEQDKYEKENRMCRQYADYGFKIEHLSEKPGESSPDVNVKSYGKWGALVKVDGELADLKSLSSANNIKRHAKYAIEKQGADKILFEFTSKAHEGKIKDEIGKISRKGYHGYYYFTGDKEPTKF